MPEPSQPDKSLDLVLTGEAQYRALTVLTPDLVFVVDDTMRVVLANPAAAHFVGRSLKGVQGARIAELFGPEGPEFEDRLAKAAAKGRPLDFEGSLSTGQAEVWMKTSLVPLEAVAPGFAVGVSRDVTESRRLQVALQSGADEIEYLATHDSLTGTGNRRAFIAALGRSVSLAARGIGTTMLYMDVDLFKRVNDERGHALGDETLAKVGKLLKGEARDVDLVARIGGDEFAALLVDTGEAGALRVAERMRAGVEAIGAAIGVPIGLSIGMTTVDPGASVDDIMSIADGRMYADKTAHRTARSNAAQG